MSRRRPRRPDAARARLALASLIALGSGCASDPTEGWTALTPFPREVRTIAIPIAENDSYVRGVEFDLTDAIIKEIEARTPYKVTAPSRADTVLLTHIRKVDLDQLSKSRFTGLGEEVLYRVTIDFQWKDLTTDATLVERKSFTGQRLFVPSTPSQERIELGRSAVVQQLARYIVDEIRAAW